MLELVLVLFLGSILGDKFVVMIEFGIGVYETKKEFLKDLLIPFNTFTKEFNFVKQWKELK